MKQHACDVERPAIARGSVRNIRWPDVQRRGCLALIFAMAAAGLILAPASAVAQHTSTTQHTYVVKPVAELKTRQLPAGELHWRIENFPTLEQAKAAAGPYRWNADTVSYEGSPSLAAEVAGKVWLFTLGTKSGKTPGGTLVAEVGPVPAITAPEYLLRVNHGSGPPGSRTAVHTHPGSEAFYVAAGRLGQKTPNGVRYVEAGHTLNGNDADVPMEVFNAGTTDLTALIMFVVDATRPFSVPAKLP
jgi:hypothetical protein